MSGQKIIAGLKEAVAAKATRVTTYLVTDIRTAQRMGRAGHHYVWEMDGDRPTGRCIVTLPARTKDKG